jgi:23S rRNA (cytidine1920-2'-O)/16S rRNA (cytidine1409-2'-O)-methyltransferase
VAKDRLDKLVVEHGLAPSRERARALILAGKVEVDGKVVDKAGALVEGAITLLEADHPYVSRGALKLVKALDHFGVDPEGKVALDAGASTGGFTDVLLRRGARKVFAVDVGYGQLAWGLRQDPRVVVLERENIRYLDPAKIDETPDLAVCDVSFISLTLILGKLAEILGKGKPIVALVKPQFEVGKGEVGKGGVVREPEKRAGAIAKVQAFAREAGMTASEAVESPILGPAGNVEYLLLLGT